MATIEELLQSQSKDIVRAHIIKIVEIYDDEWILLHELIQNAIDAIQTNPHIESGTVNVSIDLDEDKIIVSDDGTGFIHDLNLLCPGGSGKEKSLSSRSPAKGYQGVGLKAVMYSSKMFELESNTANESWTFLVQDLCEYISPDSNVVPNYDEDKKDAQGTDTWTKVTVKFKEGFVNRVLSGLERFLNEDSVKWQELYKDIADSKGAKAVNYAYLKHFLSWYFRTQSYVGCYNTLLNIPILDPVTKEEKNLKNVNISLTLKSESKFSYLDTKLGKWLQAYGEQEVSYDIPNRAWEFGEIIQENLSKNQKYRIAPRLIHTKPSDEAVWEAQRDTFKDCFLELKLLPNLKSEDFRERYKDIISILERKRSRAKAEDFKDVLNKITGIYLAIGRTSFFETFGISNHGIRQIASNGTPTAHEISIRSTSSTWYQETIHFIVNVDDNLNVGKRHLTNARLVGRINEFFEACYPKLVSISKLFVEKEPSGPDQMDLPNIIDNKKIKREGIPFTRFPRVVFIILCHFFILVQKGMTDDNTQTSFRYGRSPQSPA